MEMYDKEFVPQMYGNVAKWAAIAGGVLVFLRLFGVAFGMNLPNGFAYIGVVLLLVAGYFKFFMRRQN